jgi:hypothetical protein
MTAKIYKPIILENIEVTGMVMESADKGQKVKIVQRKFISSSDINFKRELNSLFSVFDFARSGDYLNKALIIIKPDNCAYIYQNYPLALEIRTSRGLIEGQPIFISDIADIIKVKFIDSTANLNPDTGDKFVWLFRINWEFGLYFDFTGKQTIEQIEIELGYYYKRMLYSDVYSFVLNQKNFSDLISDGWFPFIRLMGNLFDNLMLYYSEGKKFDFHEQNIIEHFTNERINEFVEGWWENSIFLPKKEIIFSGIEAYLSNTKAGYINCIKNLITELEGIIRILFYEDKKKTNPTTNEIKEYIVECGRNHFNTLSSLGFTDEFLVYLNRFVFQSFDITAPSILANRHSVAHGIADQENYSQKRALQLILTLDQVWFFMGIKKINP